MRKGKIACYKQFLFFSQCFPQLKMGYCVVMGYLSQWPTSSVCIDPASCTVDMKWTSIEHFGKTCTHLSTKQGKFVNNYVFFPQCDVAFSNFLALYKLCLSQDNPAFCCMERKQTWQSAFSTFSPSKELTHSHIMTPFDTPGKQAF